MVRRVDVGVVLLVAVTALAVPALSMGPEAVKIIRYDACNTTTGCSRPGPAGGTCNLNVVDCCNAFQLYHVHNLARLRAWSNVEIVYEPGWGAGCQDMVKVYLLAGPCTCPGANWTLIYQTPTTTQADPGGAWGMVRTILKRLAPQYPWPQKFQCVKIDTSQTPCYNDDSEVTAW
jgi:hypothetical protein